MRSPLGRFHHPMPYGASELLDGAGPRWLRAALLGSFAWAAVFTLLATTGMLDHPPARISVPKCCEGWVAPEAYRVEPTIVPHGPPPPAKVGALGEFEPVIAEQAEAAISNDLGGGSGEGRDDGIEGGAGTGDAPSGVIPGVGPANVFEPTVTPMEESEVDELPVAVHIVEPKYPELAQHAGIEGTVLLRVLVSRDGRVERVEVARSSPMFDESARVAIARWVFKPAWHRGRPVPVWVSVPVRFRMR